MVNNTINSSFLAMTFINKIIILDLNKDFFFSIQKFIQTCWTKIRTNKYWWDENKLTHKNIRIFL